MHLTRRCLVPSLAVGVALVAAWNAGRWSPRPVQSGAIAETRRPISRLVAAVGSERLIDGRLTGGFAYGPSQMRFRSSGGLSESNLALLAAAGEIQKAVDAQGRDTDRHAWGVAQLLLGELDGAVRTLEHVRAVSTSTEVAADLAAAYLARASGAGFHDDLPRALAASVEAADLPEGAFNRAVVLESLGLRAMAADAWRSYLDIDGESPWRAEAERRLSHLSESRTDLDHWRSLSGQLTLGDAATVGRVVELQPHLARVWFETEVLPTLVGARNLDDETAASWARAEALARALHRVTGDELPVRLLANLRVNDAGDPAVRARGYAALANLSSANEAGDLQRAAASIAALEEAASRGTRALLPWARVYRAQFWLRQRAYAAVLSGLSELSPDDGPVIWGRGQWLRGLAFAFEARHAEALEAFLSARKAFERSMSRPYLGRIHSQLAAMYALQGQDTVAWQHRVEAMRLADQTADVQLGDAIFNNAVVAATQADLASAAAVFLDAQARAAETWGAPQTLFQVALRRGWLRQRLGDSAGAFVHIADARRHADSIADAATRGRAVSMLALLQAANDVSRQRHSDALRRLEGSLEQPARTTLERASGLLLRAEAGEALGQVEVAERDLLGALEIVSRDYRGEETLGVPSWDVDRLWSGLERLALRLVDRGRPDRALELVDRARRRLAELERVAATQPPTVAALRNRLPAGVAVAYFVAFPTQTVVWWIDRNQVTARRLSLNRRELDDALARLTADIAAGAGGTGSAIQTLESALLRPIEHLLPGVRRLRIVADGHLANVPFAALRRVDGTPVLTSAAVSYGPFLPDDVGPVIPEPTSGVLVIGDPALGAIAARRLRQLPAARREARAVAGLYPSVRLLEGVEATAANVLDGLKSMPAIVHFAGHAVTDIGRPLDSSVALAAGPLSSEGLWPLRSFLGVDWRSDVVVVLAACSTARAAGRHSPATATFASALIANGVAGAVGTLWDIPDDSQSPVMVRFHERLASGDATDEALRVAQVEHLGQAEAAFVNWAGWVVYQP